MSVSIKQLEEILGHPVTLRGNLSLSDAQSLGVPDYLFPLVHVDDPEITDAMALLISKNNERIRSVIREYIKGLHPPTVVGNFPYKPMMLDTFKPGQLVRLDGGEIKPVT